MSRRGERINFAIQRELGALISKGLNDPRLSPMTSVTRVDVNRDLSIAKIYVSVLGDDDQEALSLKALRSAAARLRTEISHRIIIRKMPRLSFVLDRQLETGADMNRIINEVIASDSRRQSDRDPI